QRHARHAELAIVCPRTARHLTAVSHPRLRRIARQGGKLDLRPETLLDRLALIHDDRLERCALGCIAVHELAAFLVLFDCATFCHFAKSLFSPAVTAGTGS